MRTLYYGPVIPIFFCLSFPRLISAVADWMSTILRHIMWPYCEFRMHVWNLCCTRLAGNTGRKNHRHLRTIAQLCRAISSQLRHIYRQSEKSVKHQYLPHMLLQYCELRPTNSWDLLASLGHPSKFQRVSRLGSVTARHSSSGRQPNCGVEQREPPIFGRAAITLGIGPHSKLHMDSIYQNTAAMYRFICTITCCAQ